MSILGRIAGLARQGPVVRWDGNEYRVNAGSHSYAAPTLEELERELRNLATEMRQNQHIVESDGWDKAVKFGANAPTSPEGRRHENRLKALEGALAAVQVARAEQPG